MAMQTDVKVSQPLTSTGVFNDQNSTALGHVRVKAVYLISGASAGSLVITDGSGGTTLATFNTPTAVTEGSVYLLLPGEGVLATTGVYGTLTNVASATLIYG